MSKMLNRVHLFINCLLLYLTSIFLYEYINILRLILNYYSEYDQIGKTPMDPKNKNTQKNWIGEKSSAIFRIDLFVINAAFSQIWQPFVNM